MKKLRQPTSLKCFACGRENPVGLKLEWFNDYDQNQIEADFTLTDNYCSYPGVTHGGIIATILDETAGRAVLLDNNFDRLMVTLKLEIVYKKITPTGVPLKAVGRVIKDGGSRATVEGEIRLPDGTVTAKCSALLYKIPQEVKDNWGSEAEEWARTTPKTEE